MKTLLKKAFAFTGLSPSLKVFFVIMTMSFFAAGLSDHILNNYFKDAYNADAALRSVIEFPREMPGLILAVVIAVLAPLGNLRIAIVAQCLCVVGILVLGLSSPPFVVMCIFLFIYSLGGHIFMPISDSICMSLSKPEEVGLRIGEMGSLKTLGGFLSGILVFIGFRAGWFSFTTDIKMTFVVAAVVYAFAVVMCVVLFRRANADGYSVAPVKKRVNFYFKKKYKYYYMLATLNGVQKQIALVYGSWVIVDLLSKGADIMSVLLIASSFLGIFFLRMVGKWLKVKGVRFMMFVDALSFIFVYIIFGIVVYAIHTGLIPDAGWPVYIVYGLFILDRLSMNVGIVKSVYVKSIADNTEEVTSVLSTGISLDHAVSIVAALLSGAIWVTFGPHFVFFFAAALSLGNLFVAFKLKRSI